MPWEASRAALDLLALLDNVGLPRPSVFLARWFWRIAYAMPALPREERLGVALMAATHQNVGEPIPEGLEWWIAYEGARDEYKRALGRDNNPLPPFIPSLPYGGGTRFGGRTVR